MALHVETGERLWQADAATRIEASPVVWEDPSEETQHVTVAAGGLIITFPGSS